MGKLEASGLNLDRLDLTHPAPPSLPGGPCTVSYPFVTLLPFLFN